MKKSTAWIFPGQGLSADILQQTARDFGIKLLSNSRNESAQLNFTSTRIIQPLTVQISLAAAMQTSKLKTYHKPKVILGHSLGEISALATGGYISYRQAVEIATLRGQLMQEVVDDASSRGIKLGMVALLSRKPLNLSEIQELIREMYSDQMKVSIANFNSAFQIVISGIVEDLENCALWLKQKRLIDRFVRVPNLSTPFHSPWMNVELKQKFRSELERRILVDWERSHNNLIPVISNVTGREITNPKSLTDKQSFATEIIDHLVSHVSSPVKWADSVHAAHKQYQIQEWICFPPKSSVASLIEREVPLSSVSTIERPEDISRVFAGTH